MISLVDQINQSNFVFYFLVVDNSLDIHPDLDNFHLIYAFRPPKPKLPFFCLQDHHLNILKKNSGQLLSHPLVKKYIQDTSQNKSVVIIPFKPSAKIDLICHQNNWLSASNPASLNRYLEDKIKFYQLCQKFSLPTIPAVIDQFNQANFLKYQKKYNNNLVIQTHFGWAGKSTYNFSSWSQASKIIPQGTIVKYSPLLDGYTLLNNCCLTRKGLIQSPPALQYTGLKPFTNNPFTTVGRQWPSFAPSNIIDDIKAITQKFGSIISDLKYRGYFGLDFFVTNNQVYLLECNPRLTASFAFYTDLESSQNWTPLFYFHLNEFINLSSDFDINLENQRFFDQKISGSEITQKNNQGLTVKKFHFNYPLSSQANPVVIDSSFL